MATLDLQGALEALHAVEDGRNEILARILPSATRIRRALEEIAIHQRAIAPHGETVAIPVLAVAA